MEPFGHRGEQVVRERLVARDLVALAGVYDRFWPVVYAEAFRLTGDRGVAEDITRSVFTGLWCRPECFDPGLGSMGPWLASVAHDLSLAWELRDEPERHRPRPEVEEAVRAVVAAEKVRCALAALPDEQAAPIRLAFFAGHSYQQVADELGICEIVLHARIDSALRRMAVTLIS